MALPPGYLAILDAAEKMSIHLTKDEAYFLERMMQDNGWVIVAHWQVDETKRHPGLIVEHEDSTTLVQRAQAKVRDVRDGDIGIDGLIKTIDQLAETLRNNGCQG